MREDNTMALSQAFLFMLGLHLFSAVTSNPVGTNVSPDTLNYLEKYGYFVPPDPKAGQLLSEEKIVVALKKLQRFAGLKETGTLDQDTLKLVQTPRCGMADLAESSAAKRKKRYALQGSKWNKKRVTWRLMNLGNDGLTRDQIRSSITKAMNLWERRTNLELREILSGEPDIKISFARGYHQDSYPFDGEGGTLAHAFYPHNNEGISGDVHYDDDEHFTLGSREGRNFVWVTVHELGHSLGLEHSREQGAIMYPWYQGYKGDDFDLEQDDITGIQQLYGPPSEDKGSETTKTTTAPLSTERVPTTEPPIRVCTDRIGAVFLGLDDKTYVINDDKAYVLKADSTELEKGPIPVSKMFKGVDRVDAAFRRQYDRRTILFSKDKYYEFEEFKLLRPGRTITDDFHGLPKGFSDVDAAFVWPRNNKLYIFKGPLYYRFTSRQYEYVLDYDYPLKISQAWGGVPDNIDGVFAWHNKKTYFFKGTKYYRLDDRRIKVVDGYPRPIEKVWMNCMGSLMSGDPGNAAVQSQLSAALVFALLGVACMLSW